MSLASQISLLATRIGQEIKARQTARGVSTATNLWVKDHPNALVFSNGAINNAAGEFVLQTNIGSVANKMILLHFRGQSHNINEGVIDLTVRLYYNGATPAAQVAVLTSAVNLGNFRIPTVRFLRRNSDNLLAVALSPDASLGNWDYLQMSVDAQVSYGGLGADSIFDGWTGSVTTDTTAYTEIGTLTPSQSAYTGEAVTDAQLPQRLQTADQDARYKNVGEAVTDAELPARISALGANLTDWNAITETGFYRNAAASSLNAPGGSTAYFRGIAIRSGDQIGVTVWELNNNSTDTKKWQRLSTDTGATWGTWYRVRESEAELDARYNGGPAYSKIQSYAALVGTATTGLEQLVGPYTKDGTTYDQVLARYATGDAGGLLRAYGVDRNGMWTRSFWYKRRGATDTVFDIDIADNPAGRFTATANWQRATFRSEIANFAANLRFSDINFSVAGSDIYIFEDSLTFGGQPAPPDTTWIDVGANGGPAFANGWVNFGAAPDQAAQFRKIGNRVTLRGVIKSGTLGANAFVLHVGFRPPTNVRIPTTSNNAFGSVFISGNGDVLISAGSNASFSLDGISFLTD